LFSKSQNTKENENMFLPVFYFKFLKPNENTEKTIVSKEGAVSLHSTITYGCVFANATCW